MIFHVAFGKPSLSLENVFIFKFQIVKYHDILMSLKNIYKYFNYFCKERGENEIQVVTIENHIYNRGNLKEGHPGR